MRLQLMLIKRNCTLITRIHPLPARHCVRTDGFNYSGQFTIINMDRFLDLMLTDTHTRVNIMTVKFSVLEEITEFEENPWICRQITVRARGMIVVFPSLMEA